jgi:hypothetical protein
MRPRLQTAVNRGSIANEPTIPLRPRPNTATWGLARAGAVALANGFFSSGIPTVVVEGDFWYGPNPDAWRALLMPGVALTTVLLRVSFETARKRVASDASRVDSRNPALLARSHADFEAALSRLRAPDLEFVTDSLDVEMAVRAILAAS